MSEEERQAKAPWTTEDIPQHKQIVKFHAAKSNNSESGKEQTALAREFSDGTKFFEVANVPDDILNETDLKRKTAKVKKLLRIKYMNKVLDPSGVRAFFNGQLANEFANPAKKGIDTSVLHAKFNTANNLEEIISSSTNPRTILDGEYGHVHANVKGWEHRDVLFAVGGRFYSGKVNIQLINKVKGKTGDFRKFHDITQIKDITDGVHDLHGSIKSQSYPSTIGETMSIIAQTNSKVNRAKLSAGRRVVTKEMDQQYLDAVKSGDTAKALELVRDVAEKNGYTDDTSYRSSHHAPNAEYCASLDDVTSMFGTHNREELTRMGIIVFLASYLICDNVGIYGAVEHRRGNDGTFKEGGITSIVFTRRM